MIISVEFNISGLNFPSTENISYGYDDSELNGVVGTINSIPKVKKIEVEGFALKKLKLHFLRNFPRFDLTASFCDFPHIRPMIFH